MLPHQDCGPCCHWFFTGMPSILYFTLVWKLCYLTQAGVLHQLQNIVQRIIHHAHELIWLLFKFCHWSIFHIWVYWEYIPITYRREVWNMQYQTHLRVGYSATYKRQTTWMLESSSFKDGILLPVYSLKSTVLQSWWHIISWHSFVVYILWNMGWVLERIILFTIPFELRIQIIRMILTEATYCVPDSFLL